MSAYFKPLGFTSSRTATATRHVIFLTLIYSEGCLVINLLTIDGFYNNGIYELKKKKKHTLYSWKTKLT